MAQSKITSPDEWLKPKDIQRIFKIGHNKYYQFVRDGAFPVSKPDPKGRAVFVRKSDVEKFFERGYPKAA
ncbi:helix-turn-helix domain-containing protein [Spirosoma fluviale]|uniref:helix-turn-helix domain-containing protein n=1 Tax=Spirosoma fluviale TaxID=1597977 RepID=UPI000BE2E6C0